MSIEDERDWSNPQADAVDGIADVLKRTRRWRRDGPSLRSLNKHWCQCISANVHEIGSDCRGGRCVDDSKALRKFPKATSVVIDRFLGARAGDYDGLVLDLAAMPSLKRLVCGVSNWRDFLMTANLSPLTRVKELRCQGSFKQPSRFVHRSRPSPASQEEKLIKKVSVLQIEALELNSHNFYVSLRYLLDTLPHLKRLSAKFQAEITAAEVAGLNRLESVALRYPRCWELLSDMTSLTDVAVHMRPGLLEKLAMVQSLKSIQVEIDHNSFEPGSVRVVDVSPLARLRSLADLQLSLKSSTVASWELYVGSTFQSLKYLFLEAAILSDFKVLEVFPNVVKAELWTVTVRSVEERLTCMEKVENLVILNNCPFREPLTVAVKWSPEGFPKLRTLYLTYADFDWGAFGSLFTLTRLEDLAISVDSLSSTSDDEINTWLNQIYGLKNLRRLTIRGIPHMEYRLSEDFLDNLESYSFS